MSTLTVELPDALAAQLDAAVELGWFENKAEVVRAAVRDFVGHGRLALQERQQMEDIAWAVEMAEKKA